jgi:hypothetical protein
VNIYVISVHGLKRKALIEDGTENQFSILSERVWLLRRYPIIDPMEIRKKIAIFK